MNNRTEPFPVDWDEWRTAWEAWLAEQTAGKRGADGYPPRLAPSSYHFGGKNFLANNVLGVFSLRSPGRTGPVELSEVTFPDLSGERHGERVRYVGVTFGSGSGNESGGIVATFEELERALGIIIDTPRNAT